MVAVEGVEAVEPDSRRDHSRREKHHKSKHHRSKHRHKSHHKRSSGHRQESPPPPKGGGLLTQNTEPTQVPAGDPAVESDPESGEIPESDQKAAAPTSCAVLLPSEADYPGIPPTHGDTRPNAHSAGEAEDPSSAPVRDGAANEEGPTEPAVPQDERATQLQAEDHKPGSSHATGADQPPVGLSPPTCEAVGNDGTGSERKNDAKTGKKDAPDTVKDREHKEDRHDRGSHHEKTSKEPAETAREQERREHKKRKSRDKESKDPKDRKGRERSRSRKDKGKKEEKQKDADSHRREEKGSREKGAHREQGETRHQSRDGKHRDATDREQRRSRDKHAKPDRDRARSRDEPHERGSRRTEAAPRGGDWPDAARRSGDRRHRSDDARHDRRDDRRDRSRRRDERSADRGHGKRGRSRSGERDRGHGHDRRGSGQGKRSRGASGSHHRKEDAAEVARLEAALLGSAAAEEDDAEKRRLERKRRQAAILQKHASAGALTASINAPTANDAVARSAEAGATGTPDAEDAPAVQGEAAVVDGDAEMNTEAAEGDDAAAASASDFSDADSVGEGVDIFDAQSGPRPTSAGTAGPEGGASAAMLASGIKPQHGVPETAKETGAGVQRAGPPQDDDDVDMFAEDDAAFEVKASRETQARQAAGLADAYDDAEGYYKITVGEVLDNRYKVASVSGQGVFASVIMAHDLARPGSDPGVHAEVAIKVVRNNELMRKAGQTEIRILELLGKADPGGKRHVVRMLRHFEHRGHLCIVFEALMMNLRELVKKFGRNIGISTAGTQLYATQLLIALGHLRGCGVLHADIKPDNILVSSNRSKIKLCDLGSAMAACDNEPTPYLVSRFYRPPEVILGLRYGHAMDVWSIGCVLYELATGKILFPGRTNNEMLKLFMETKGAIPKKMVRRALQSGFAEKHFKDASEDPNMSFISWEEDPVTKAIVPKLIPNPHVVKDFSGKLSSCKTSSSAADRRLMGLLADLLEKMMALDPEKRITPAEALRHPFIRDASNPLMHSKHKDKDKAKKK